MADAAAQDLLDALGLAVDPAPGDLEIIADALAQAHAEGRAEGLEAAALEYDAPDLADVRVYCRHVAQRLRALAGQPSGDAK